MLGPPGSGKGTQATLIAENLKIPQISSGDLFRDHQDRDTELGQLARSYMKDGVLVPDKVTITMVMDWIEQNTGVGGFLLDGFPRTIAQAKALDQALADSGGIDLAIYVNVPETELVHRLSGRLVCSKCKTQYHTDFAPPSEPCICDKCITELNQRDDDKPEAIKKRFQVYQEETAPLIDYYQVLGRLREVNGVGSIEKIGERMLKALH